MKRHGLMLAAMFAVGALACWLLTADGGSPAVAQEAAPPPATAGAAQADSAEAGIKKITAEYEKAFNAADAKAAAALWTAEG